MFKNVSSLALIGLVATMAFSAESPEVTILAEKQYRSDDGVILRSGCATACATVSSGPIVNVNCPVGTRRPDE